MHMHGADGAHASSCLGVCSSWGEEEGGGHSIRVWGHPGGGADVLRMFLTRGRGRGGGGVSAAVCMLQAGGLGGAGRTAFFALLCQSLRAPAAHLPPPPPNPRACLPIYLPNGRLRAPHPSPSPNTPRPTSVAPPPAAASAPSGPAPTDGQLCAFWVEEGLSSAAAARLVAELQQQQQTSGRPPLGIAQLSAITQRWRRVLPDMDISELVARDSGLLTADVSLAIRNLVTLVAAFPGRDVSTLLRRQPRLLWCDDLPERVERVLQRLTVLHPSKDVGVCAAIVVENPELLYR